MKTMPVISRPANVASKPCIWIFWIGVGRRIFLSFSKLIFMSSKRFIGGGILSASNKIYQFVFINHTCFKMYRGCDQLIDKLLIIYTLCQFRSSLKNVRLNFGCLSKDSIFFLSSLKFETFCCCQRLLSLSRLIS